MHTKRGGEASFIVDGEEIKGILISFAFVIVIYIMEGNLNKEANFKKKISNVGHIFCDFSSLLLSDTAKAQLCVRGKFKSF